MNDYGAVKIRLRNGRITDGKLLEFLTIPIQDRDNNTELKVLVYGVVETDDGDFMARQLSEIKRREFRDII